MTPACHSVPVSRTQEHGAASLTESAGEDVPEAVLRQPPQLRNTALLHPLPIPRIFPKRVEFISETQGKVTLSMKKSGIPLKRVEERSGMGSPEKEWKILGMAAKSGASLRGDGSATAAAGWCAAACTRKLLRPRRAHQPREPPERSEWPESSPDSGSGARPPPSPPSPPPPPPAAPRGKLSRGLRRLTPISILPWSRSWRVRRVGCLKRPSRLRRLQRLKRLARSQEVAGTRSGRCELKRSDICPEMCEDCEERGLCLFR
eukprot:gene12454-biopygen12017